MGETTHGVVSRARVSFRRVTLSEIEMVVGRGTHEDPIRTVRLYYWDDGSLLCEDDPAMDAPTAEAVER